MSILPTRVEPVNDIYVMSVVCRSVVVQDLAFLMIGELVIALPTSAVFFNAVTMLTTPGGTPARSPSKAMAAPVSGVSPGVFNTTVHPAASAGPTLRVIMPSGQFLIRRGRRVSRYLRAVVLLPCWRWLLSRKVRRRTRE